MNPRMNNHESEHANPCIETATSIMVASGVNAAVPNHDKPHAGGVGSIQVKLLNIKKLSADAISMIETKRPGFATLDKTAAELAHAKLLDSETAPPR